MVLFRASLVLQQDSRHALPDSPRGSPAGAGVSFADGEVTFRWRDSAHNNEQRSLPLSVDEFLRRFLLHLFPEGFVRIRNFGFLANRKRATTLPRCFQLLGSAPQTEQQGSTNDLDFKAGTIRVDESADQRTYIIGPCKNVAAYRTILVADAEGREALSMLKRFLKGSQTPTSLVFRSKRGTAPRETSVLHRFLHPVLRTLGFSSSWDACVSSRLQSQMGVVRDESCRTPPTNGSQLCCNDGKILCAADGYVEWLR